MSEEYADHVASISVDFGSEITLPDSSSDEFLSEWQWDAVVDATEPKSSPVAHAYPIMPPAEFPAFITAEDHELVAPLLEERANKRARLTIDHPTEPLFPTHADWSASSPQVHFTSHLQLAGPVISPLPDFPQVYTF
jgi:hypothetical protein